MKTLLGTNLQSENTTVNDKWYFLVGCAYQTSAVPIDFGIESRTDLNGDGKKTGCV